MAETPRRGKLALNRRLEEAESIIQALETEQVDAVVGERGVSLLRLKEVEERLQQAHAELEVRVAERTAEARQRTEQLQALALQLTEAEERERRRLAVLLHDGLQQQLAAMRLHVGVLGRRVADESGQRILAGLRQSLDEAITNSRTLSQELSPPVLYIEGLAAALEWLGRNMCEKQRLQVEVEAAPEADIKDQRLQVFMFQAARELLFNVVKHAGVDSARLRLRRVNGEVELVVEDRGRGFAPALLDKAGKASGMGLLSIRERAELLGARLVIDSAPGRGSRVGLRWAAQPVAAARVTGFDREQAAGAGVRARAAQVLVDGSRILRILLADDHAVMRQGLSSLLEDEGDLLVVGEATNGAEAIEAAQRLQPDVVVMDVSMPEVDGIDATRRIKREIPHIRVIGLSMFDEGETERRMRSAGADAYLAKSCRSADLLAAIRGGPASGGDHETVE